MIGPGIALCLTGCTHVFFQPSPEQFTNPKDLDPLAQAVRFRSGDGTPLHGFFFPARRGPARGTVVHFHGNAQNVTAHFLFAHWLVDRGFNLFAFDYRGYGASGGTPSVKGAIDDGVAAIQTAAVLDGGVPARIVVFGQSLGGALAVAAVARAKGLVVRALALEGPFASYATIAEDKMAAIHFPKPVRWTLSRIFFSTRHHPLRYLSRLPRVPLVVVHGDNDPVVPYREGKTLFDRASQPKELWTVPGGRHTDAFTVRREEYQPRLEEFFLKALAAP